MMAEEESLILPGGGLTRVVELLSDVLIILTDDPSASGSCGMPPFCRVAVYPGPTVPFDSCETDACGGGTGDGQLWGAVQSVTRNPASAGRGCERYDWSAQVGAVRCAAKPKDDGSPPSTDAVQSDAIRQAIDADMIFRGIKCCPRRGTNLAAAAITVESWTPVIGGGCVGGFWTISGRFDVCC